MTTVNRIHEVKLGNEGEDRLCFHWAEYKYDDGSSEFGYRFMWRKPNGNLVSHRGQARIPSAKELFLLLKKAEKEGWFEKCESG
ncbi:MAG: hypothetical protein OXU88_04835 [Gammaproteobacteria bacterium]|nr:hypothetical protein [Gammaproteobacteria bacterium]